MPILGGVGGNEGIKGETLSSTKPRNTILGQKEGRGPGMKMQEKGKRKQDLAREGTCKKAEETGLHQIFAERKEKVVKAPIPYHIGTSGGRGGKGGGLRNVLSTPGNQTGLV